MKDNKYVAQDKQGNQYDFEWGADDTFYLILDGKKVEANIEHYEIIEIEIYCE